MAAGPIDNSLFWKSDAGEWIAEEFDDTFLVFYRPSAETHFLNFLSFGVLRQCAREPQSANSLMRNLRQEFEIEDAELPLSLVQSVIEQLDDTGLVKPVVSK